jgi:hypothetical protein
VKEDSLKLPTVHSRTSTGQWIKRFSKDDGAADNFISVQIAMSKEKSILGLFSWDSSLDMNTKNLENSPMFLSVTHMILSAKRFRCYRISKIDFAADFCFWAEQRLNET